MAKAKCILYGLSDKVFEEHLEKGLNGPKIAAIYNVTRYAVYDRLRKAGLKVKKSAPANKIDWSGLDPILIKDYKNFKTLDALSKFIGVNKITLQKHLIRDLKIYHYSKLHALEC